MNSGIFLYCIDRHLYRLRGKGKLFPSNHDPTMSRGESPGGRTGLYGHVRSHGGSLGGKAVFTGELLSTFEPL
jgi:hypothetical protein